MAAVDSRDQLKDVGTPSTVTECDSESDSDSSPDSPIEEKASDLFVVPESECERHLWYIHGRGYDLKNYVAKHPGGPRMILSGRGRDCTALFESYHPWNDKHRRVLAAYGPKAPEPDPFYEDIKAEVRKAYPLGYKETQMRWRTFCGLYVAICLELYLFFVVKTLWSCAIAGFLMALFGTRMAHEGAHFQMSHKEWVNRLSLFLGYFVTGPSMNWHYRHVISHHAHTNQSDDVDVAYIWVADTLPRWLKVWSTPGIPIGVMLEIGLRGVWDLLIVRDVGGNRVDTTLGHIWLEVPFWCAFHYFFGPSVACYLCMMTVAGAIFVPCSQVAHAILYPDPSDHQSWAKMQIADSADFASDSNFWYHVAFGLTTQIEHHLFPGIGHHHYHRIRLITKEVCKKHGVHHIDITAKKAFHALWIRWVTGQPISVA